MELSTIQTIDKKVNLLHPKTGEELGLVFDIRSPDSDEVKSINREWQNKRLQPKFRNKAIRSEELEALTDKRIKAAVMGWTWEDPNLTLNGEQPEYSPKALMEMMREFPWIRDFLSDECEDLSSFF